MTLFPHDYPFDPAYGYDLARLAAVEPPPAPPGFHDFWATRYDAAHRLDPQPQLRQSNHGHPDWLVKDIVYRSTGAFRIGGWLLLPRSGRIARGLVVGHGYGGRDRPDFDIPVTDTAVLFPCFRGLSLSSRPPISTNPDWHVLHDIDKPDHYVIGGCVEDLWLAVSVLIELYPWLAGQIAYAGISFGGGIGALAIPQDPRIDRGHLALPTFGHQPLRLALPSVGSARSVQDHARRHPEVADTLRYFDAAVAAAGIRVPMLMALARFDPAVAPPCQFAIANALPRNCCETVILDAGHFDYPERAAQDSALRETLRRFLKVS